MSSISATSTQNTAHFQWTKEIWNQAWHSNDGFSMKSLCAKVACIVFPILLSVALVESILWGIRSIFTVSSHPKIEPLSPDAVKQALEEINKDIEPENPVVNPLEQPMPKLPTDLVITPDAPKTNTENQLETLLPVAIAQAPKGAGQLFSDIERQALLNTLQGLGEKQNTQLVRLLDQLSSQDEGEVRQAEEEIRYFQEQDVTFHTIVLHSFPIWPIDYLALNQIAVDQSESRHPILRQRAFYACSYLVSQTPKLGYEIAAVLASKKMHSDEEAIQIEGLKYFIILLKQMDPQLTQDDLALAISIAKKISVTARWLVASTFFEELVKNGKVDDVAQIKNTVLDLCGSDDAHAQHIGRTICKAIVLRHHKHANLVEISLQAAISMCASEDQFKRGEGLDLFWLLLRWSPELTMDPLLQALEIESKRNKPMACIVVRLEELAGHDFSNLFHSAEVVILQRAKNDAPTLLRILTNLSTADAYFQEKALTFKQAIEKRMNEA
jgi:hypothetical protein